MDKPFLEKLSEEGVLGDGAMGTEIYGRGIFLNRNYDELNLSSPTLIRDIHLDYLNAGAQVLETNTFTANRPALAAFGFENKVKEINRAGAKIAKDAAKGQAYIAGAVGPVSWTFKQASVLGDNDIKAIFAEQIQGLVEGGVDLIILETFLNLDELKLAYEAARSVKKNLPIVTQVTLKYEGEEGFKGIQPAEACRLMCGWGADVVGVNCCTGPVGVLEAIKLMTPVATKPLSAFPNAGLPQVKQNRLLYLATPEYMAEFARRLVQAGAHLVGGCCGTTPEMIKEMKRYLKTLRPTKRIESIITLTPTEEIKKITPMPVEKRSAFGAILGKKFAVSVEIDPPKGLDASRAIEGAKFLKEHGVDVINIADGPRAMARMSPIAMSVLIKQQLGMETVIHYCCRDRNLLGMQMDLIGANAVGLKNILVITGDPPKMGEYPDATAVFDVDAIGLIHFINNLNHGLDFANRPIGEATSLVIGCGCNPGAIDMDIEVERLRKKIEAGAEFIFSQPVYESKLLDKFLAKSRSFLKIPFFVGILPLASLKNAEFLHNEVPGMQVPNSVMDQLKKAATKEAQREIGLKVAQEALKEAHDMTGVKGVYIFPPFGKYEAVLELLKVIQ
ncbi:MAG: bifunctional homocysteine S-methyltransferase/methylenetetrahydrofolate reductase [Deltaproteobacteria bacterium RIFCSPLOWO2_01_FULL_45_74]|nr:MAG: bifunctional homocysteine S-methyltransferase/methylenetetrahydrofolate reductase [Deltaproteobacteria bacterium RIFCSPHIGHO2_01_FULL_43_49]OGQ15110.1 MAG: bifunctional homocysteine S-methyltransferase/methylenetetrahydrofolate reductase [Deltaproteobacteria bacterium RIFCSPHIGHO2_02_FULL_44_53]OGQ27270.1 MAG: bifunctional homocysteine S-methyltransferase/methylenetetrahydrofolate reductase [Deltaproteobacteria bacterium RIFCSPHIGHO2_12_FULL_44_21]OGQ31627.1 MAG: bifunctional homocystein